MLVSVLILIYSFSYVGTKHHKIGVKWFYSVCLNFYVFLLSYISNLFSQANDFKANEILLRDE